MHRFPPTPAPVPRARRRRPAGLAAAALAVALTFAAVACGGGSSSNASGGEFCGSMKSLASKFKDTANLNKDDFDALLDSLGEVSPPAALKADWNTFLQSRDLVDNPEQATADKVDAITKASGRIDSYLKDTCHLDV